jgi:hypothetical protein
MSKALNIALAALAVVAVGVVAWLFSAGETPRRRATVPDHLQGAWHRIEEAGADRPGTRAIHLRASTLTLVTSPADGSVRDSTFPIHRVEFTTGPGTEVGSFIVFYDRARGGPYSERVLQFHRRPPPRMFVQEFRSARSGQDYWATLGNFKR